MKQVLCVVVGAIAGVMLATLLAYGFNHWYAERYVRSDDDANVLVGYYLFGFFPAGLLVGGYAGHRVGRRRGAAP
ncbi:hypothetical protein M4R22_14320 [Acidovorax sp. GBBC 3334]|uniref:hypothetical protein n=1 Tax=Acidovorax sp. GBBC 3334 TaxID=2940496 RepID=UPI002303B343|nr:hypothetical protein [Acidovorax sp. GBBC 3334]MDA8455945.1 hypothetical protein [Acidovorax sp. GBBC 3334]